MTRTVPGRAAQFGLGRQTAVGIANIAAASTWVKWRQGSMLSPKMDVQHDFEGDGSRGEALVYKKSQYGTGKLTFAPRPAEAAQIFAAFSGAASDAVGTVANALYPHVITPGKSANDFYTLHQQLTGVSAGNKQRVRVSDAVCYAVSLSTSTAAPVLILDTDWYGINTTIDSTVVAVLDTDFEAAGPFFLYSTAGQWTLPGATSAVGAVKGLDLKFAQELNPEDFQTESITPLPYVPGNLTISGDLTILWQDGGLAAYAYMNNQASDDTTAHPSAAGLPTGDLNVTFNCSSDVTAGAAHPRTLTLDLPNAVFEDATFTPDLSGKPIEQKVTIRGIRYSDQGVAADPYTVTVQTPDQNPYSS
jgi:hypothetical protein